MNARGRLEQRRREDGETLGRLVLVAAFFVCLVVTLSIYQKAFPPEGAGACWLGCPDVTATAGMPTDPPGTGITGTPRPTWTEQATKTPGAPTSTAALPTQDPTQTKEPKDPTATPFGGWPTRTPTGPVVVVEPIAYPVDGECDFCAIFETVAAAQATQAAFYGR